MLRYLATGEGFALATASVVAKTLVLYTIMVTGSIWEKEVFGRWLFAPAFFWEDVFSMLVLALHTAYLVAVAFGVGDAPAQMLLALAAYAAYVVNAAQFLLKLRAARLEGATAAPRDRRRSARAWPRERLRRRRRSRATPAERPVLRERGQREVFCGLTGIVWLHRKMRDAFFLVVGSRTCAHLLQSAAGVMIFAEPRFATAIIDERDLAGMADANAELDRVVARLLERRPDIRLLFLVGSCPSEVIKLDLARAAKRLDRAASRRRAGAALLRQRHRDDLHAGRGRLPRRAGAGAAGRSDGRAALAARGRRAGGGGRGPDAAALRRARHRPGALPAAAPRAPTCRRSGRARGSCSRSPSSAETARVLEERGARRHRGAVPAGRGGHDALAARRRRRLGRAAGALPRGDGRAASSARATAVARHRDALAGRRGLPLPRLRSSKCRWRASCRASSAWSRSRSARPTCTASTSRRSSTLLPPGTALSEGQHVDRQLDRCRAAQPDLVVCGLGLANPLEAEGIATKWSIELVFTPVQGYEQAGDLAALFARPLDRRERLRV